METHSAGVEVASLVFFDGRRGNVTEQAVAPRRRRSVSMASKTAHSETTEHVRSQRTTGGFPRLWISPRFAQPTAAGGPRYSTCTFAHRRQSPPAAPAPHHGPRVDRAVLPLRRAASQRYQELNRRFSLMFRSRTIHPIAESKERYPQNSEAAGCSLRYGIVSAVPTDGRGAPKRRGHRRDGRIRRRGVIPTSF